MSNRNFSSRKIKVLKDIRGKKTIQRSLTNREEASKVVVTQKEYSKNRLKRGESSYAYLTRVCRLPRSVESLERIDEKPELSANTVAFISCFYG